MDKTRLSSREKWDGYWKDLATTTGEVPWDTDPLNDTAKILAQCADLMDQKLQLVDLGCGNGRRTRYLAGLFPKVIGVDVSAEAIRGARELYSAPNMDFRLLDATAPAQAALLHDEIGDANVHVLTMFHQLNEADRPAAALTLATLAGKRGRAIVCELGPDAEGLFAAMKASGAPPEKFARLFEQGIVPGRLSDNEIPRLLAPHGFKVLRQSQWQFSTTIPGLDQQFPIDWWVLARD